MLNRPFLLLQFCGRTDFFPDIFELCEANQLIKHKNREPLCKKSQAAGVESAMDWFLPSCLFKLRRGKVHFAAA
jgi:hypothetical protein